jgi:hypothetical protein
VVRVTPVVLDPAFVAGVVLLLPAEDNAPVARNAGVVLGATCLAE